MDPFTIGYILIGIPVAFAAGVFTYRHTKSTDSMDYVPAILTGLVWPIALVLEIIAKILEWFALTCKDLSESIDEAERKMKEEKSRKQSASETSAPEAKADQTSASEPAS